MLALRRFVVLSVLLTIVLAACTLPNGPALLTPLTSNSATDVAPVKSSKPAATANSSGSVVKAKKPPQTHAVGIQPPGRREELTRLSHLLKFKAIGLDGAPLGQISDFVINTCETYIIYFTVAPDASLKVAEGDQLVIPFEVVSINSGVFDAEAKTMSIYMTPEQVAASPVFAAPLTLLPYAPWEDAVRDYWMSVARVGMLKSECRAGGSNSANAVHKIAYASQLIGAELKDYNHNLLGKVKDAILEPESGKLGFYVVKLLDDSLVMVSLSQTNIPKEALQPGATIELVLLAEVGKLAGAPRIPSIEAGMNAQTQATSRNYWKK